MRIFDFFNKKVDIDIGDNTIVTVHNRKEAEFYASGMLKIANDCANLVNTTKKADVFFPRYYLLLEKLENLAKLEKFNCFRGTSPSVNLSNTLDRKNLTINDFIDRFYNDTLYQINKLKTEKAKEKRIEKFYDELSKYNDYMLPENVKKYTSLYESLLRK